MLLESSRALGSGKRIPIRFAENGALKVRGGAPGVKGFGCWSGAIVGVKGRNGGGGAFVIEEVLQVSVFSFRKLADAALAATGITGSDIG